MKYLFKKMILTLSFLVVVYSMGLALAPQSQLKADTQAPGTYVYSDFFLGNKIKFDNVSTSVSGYTTNGYVTVPKQKFVTVSMTLPDFRSNIGNWESLSDASAYIRVTGLYVGEEQQRSYQKLFGQYGAKAFTSEINYSNQTTPMRMTVYDIDAKTLPSAIEFQLALLDTRLSMNHLTGLSGEFRIYSIELRINYTYNDEISPLLDGAGSLVQSKNILNLPIYENTINGITLSIDEEQIITINGTSIMDSYFSNISIEVNLNGTYTMSYIAVSGTKTLESLPSIYFNNHENGDFNVWQIGNTFTHTSNKSLNYLIIAVGNGVTYNNYKIRIQLESGSNSTPWMHPDSIYYSTASIQHDKAPDSVSTIMSNVYAYDDVDGNITDRFVTVNTARKYAAVLANKWRLNVNEVLAAYDDNTLSIPITNTITLNKAYVDAQFDTYKVGTYWYNLENDSIIPKGLTAPYKFIAYVGDDAGNYSFLEISVFVTDATAPVFDASNQTTISVSYKTTYNLTTWVANLVITDNVSTVISRYVYTDNYTASKSTPGSYTVIVRATDDAGNTKDKTFTFIVIDDIAPVFNGPEAIMKPQSSTMTIADIKGRYTAYDEISGTVTSRIVIFSDGYTRRGHIVGTYTVVFRVTDLSNNHTDLTVIISVSDDIPPVIYVADGYFIQVSSAYVLTIEGIKAILVATGRLEIVSATTYQVLVNEYAGNESTPGIYTISIRFSQTSGVTEVHSVAVNVKNASTIPDGQFNPPSSMGWLIPVALVSGAVVLFLIFRKKR